MSGNGRGAGRGTVVQGYPRLGGPPPNGDNPFPTVTSGARAIEGLSRPAPANPADAGLRPAFGLPAATPPAPREDQMLGYVSEYMKPWDNAARWLEAGVNRMGVPTGAIDRGLNLPTAEQAADAHAAYIEQMRRLGIVPGGVGGLFGAVASGIPLMGLNPLAGLLAGAALNTDRNSPQGAALDSLFGAGPRPSGQGSR